MFYYSKARHQTGVTLIEVMIGITIGLLIMASLTVVFVNSSRSNSEIERTSQQIENGRYASQSLAENLALAGYYGELDPVAVPTPGAKPDACESSATALMAAIALPIQGYDDGETTPTCLPADLVANSDILVVRRSSTCVAGSTDCDGIDYSKSTYFQTGLCPIDAGQYVIDTDAAEFTLTKPIVDPTGPTCGNAITPGIHKADLRAYHTHIYFVTQNNKTGDGIPTLKMKSLGSESFGDAVPIAAGIERMQLEYGVTADATSAPVYTSAPADAAAWRKVTAVKVHLLARNITATPGHNDLKTYVMGKQANGTDDNTVAPGGAYKRHVYTSVVRLNNIAGRM